MRESGWRRKEGQMRDGVVVLIFVFVIVLFFVFLLWLLLLF
jgi:hypothetical protein